MQKMAQFCYCLRSLSLVHVIHKPGFSPNPNAVPHCLCLFLFHLIISHLLISLFVLSPLTFLTQTQGEFGTESSPDATNLQFRHVSETHIGLYLLHTSG